MSSSEQLPSNPWSALTFQGEKFAEVRFESAGVVTFRMPQESLQIPGMREILTLENLLAAVARSPEEVESWQVGERTYSALDGSESFKLALPVAEQGLDVRVRIKSLEPNPQSPIPDGVSPALWQDLELRWKAILILETAMDALRVSMEGLLIEMESNWRKPLSTEAKAYAPRADVAQWNKAKSRVHTALPRMKDFIHRAIWSIASPERKRLEEIYTANIHPQVAFSEIDNVLKQLEDLRKDRQVLISLGKTVHQECRAMAAELQSTLRTLESNAARAQKKKDSSSKSRYF